MPQYRNIIFLQDPQDFDDFSGSGGAAQNGFFESTGKEQFLYLAQWALWDHIKEELEEDPWGKNDTIHEITVGNTHYVMNINEHFQYAGLSKKAMK